MLTTLDHFTGTAKQFEDARVYLNGVELTQISVNALARHAIIETVGDGPKPARGKTPKVYRVTGGAGMFVQRKVDCGQTPNDNPE